MRNGCRVVRATRRAGHLDGGCGGAGLSAGHAAALQSWREAEARPDLLSKFQAAAEFLVSEQGRWSACSAAEFVRLVHSERISNAHRTAFGRMVCLRRPDLALSCSMVRGVVDEVGAIAAQAKRRGAK